MIRVKILEIDKHRNETTFRPYIWARQELYKIGVEFVNDDHYDMAWVGQASIADKKLPLNDSVEQGLAFCRKIDKPFMIFDGQDSHSLIGTYEVFKHAGKNCLLMMKNTLLDGWSKYTEQTPNGRWYWGEHRYIGSPFDLNQDELSDRISPYPTFKGRGHSHDCPDIYDYADRIILSGTNWLSTTHYGVRNIPDKKYDVCALFGYPLTEGTEHGVEHYRYYNAHRKPCVEALEWIRDNTDYSVKMLSGGVKLPQSEYYNIMAQSKVVVAPFGFGEIAPRDIESAAFGAVLIKPDMGHIRTYPNIYQVGHTYIPCEHDFCDLADQVDEVLSNYEHYQILSNNMWYQYSMKYTPQKLAAYMVDVLSENLSEILA